MKISVLASGSKGNNSYIETTNTNYDYNYDLNNLNTVEVQQT